MAEEDDGKSPTESASTKACSVESPVVTAVLKVIGGAFAVRQDRPELVARLLAARGDVNAQIPISAVARRDGVASSKLPPEAGKQQCPLLHLAALAGLPDTFRDLWQNGAESSWRDNVGWTLLHACASGGDVSITQLCLESIVTEVDICDSDNDTPLHVAAFAGRDAVAKLLLDKKADATRIDADKCSPLHCACRSGIWPLVEKLLAAKADPSAVDGHGGTPLAYAVLSHADGLEDKGISLLREAGARVCDASMVVAQRQLASKPACETCIAVEKELRRLRETDAKDEAEQAAASAAKLLLDEETTQSNKQNKAAKSKRGKRQLHTPARQVASSFDSSASCSASSAIVAQTKSGSYDVAENGPSHKPVGETSEVLFDVAALDIARRILQSIFQRVLSRGLRDISVASAVKMRLDDETRQGNKQNKAAKSKHAKKQYTPARPVASSFDSSGSVTGDVGEKGPSCNSMACGMQPAVMIKSDRAPSHKSVDMYAVDFTAVDIARRILESVFLRILGRGLRDTSVASAVTMPLQKEIRHSCKQNKEATSKRGKRQSHTLARQLASSFDSNVSITCDFTQCGPSCNCRASEMESGAMIEASRAPAHKLVGEAFPDFATVDIARRILESIFLRVLRRGVRDTHVVGTGHKPRVQIMAANRLHTKKGSLACRRANGEMFDRMASQLERKRLKRQRHKERKQVPKLPHGVNEKVEEGQDPMFVRPMRAEAPEFLPVLNESLSTSSERLLPEYVMGIAWAYAPAMYVYCEPEEADDIATGDISESANAACFDFIAGDMDSTWFDAAFGYEYDCPQQAMLPCIEYSSESWFDGVLASEFDEDIFDKMSTKASEISDDDMCLAQISVHVVVQRVLAKLNLQQPPNLTCSADEKFFSTKPLVGHSKASIVGDELVASNIVPNDSVRDMLQHVQIQTKEFGDLPECDPPPDPLQTELFQRRCGGYQLAVIDGSEQLVPLPR